MSPERRSEHFGQTEVERPEGLLLWILSETAADIGPAPALSRELSQRLDAPVHVLATPLSETPLVPAVQRAIIHQFAPGDTDGSARRFLDHWEPDLALVIGTPARGTLLAAAAAAEIPLFFASPRRNSVTAGRRVPGYLNTFHTCFTAAASEATILRSALVTNTPNVEISGPLTDTSVALPCNEAECDDFAKKIAGRPIWLAAEIEGIEIDIIEAAHRKAFRSAHRLLLILVPRPDCDAAEIVARLEHEGWRVARRSQDQEPEPETQIYVADTENEMGLWYRLAPASFVGGSLSPKSEPADPFDPAALGSAVLCGPNTGINPSRFEQLAAQKALMPVRNADELGEAVVTLLAPDKAASLAQAGWASVTESAHVVEQIADVMTQVMDDKEGVF